MPKLGLNLIPSWHNYCKFSQEIEIISQFAGKITSKTKCFETTIEIAVNKRNVSFVVRQTHARIHAYLHIYSVDVIENAVKFKGFLSSMTVSL